MLIITHFEPLADPEGFSTGFVPAEKSVRMHRHQLELPEARESPVPEGWQATMPALGG